MANKSILYSLSTLHLLVDGVCVCCLMMAYSCNGGAPFALFLTYTLLAFATQPLTGMLVDRLLCHKTAIMLSMLLLTAGVLTWLLLPTPSATADYLSMALLGLGNSLFHVAGGKEVSAIYNNDMRPMGFFVSTGAVGLTIGTAFSSPVLLVCLTIAIIAIVFIQYFGIPYLTPSEQGEESTSISDVAGLSKASVASSRVGEMGGGLLLFTIMFIVAGRSFIGKCVPALPANTIALTILISAVVMMGKASGGFAALLFGKRKTLVASLLLACLCLMLCPVSILFIPVTLFLINISMPITLHYANRMMPGNEGLAFGLLAAALLPGYALGEICSQEPLLSNILLFPLLGTIIIEGVMLLYLRESRWRVLMAMVLMNILTNVPLNIVVRAFSCSVISIVIAELAVLIVEFLIYLWVTHDRRKAFIYSLLCNAMSCLVGLLVQIINHQLSIF